MGAGPELEGGGERRVESQEVCPGHGAGSTGIEGLGRPEGSLREVGIGVERWAPQGHFLLECSGLWSY